MVVVDGWLLDGWLLNKTGEAHHRFSLAYLATTIENLIFGPGTHANRAPAQV